MKPSLEMLLESALFFKGGAVSMRELAEIFKTTKEEIEKAADALSASLNGRGIRLVRERDMLALGTAPETNDMIEKMRKEELEGPLGKAGLETLSIVVFRGPLSRADVEYVRGVNCSSILRSLTIRGLIERVENPKDKRSFLYQATTELPAYLGVAQLSDIPNYQNLRDGIEKVYETREKEGTDANSTGENGEIAVQ